MPIFNPSYTYVRDVHCSRDIETTPNFNLEIAAALVVSDISMLFDGSDVPNYNKTQVNEKLNIYIQGDLKKLGDGLTCSNFRKKGDSITNNLVVKNTFEIMMTMDKPKCMTSYPRSVRTITVNVNGLEKFGKDIVVLDNQNYDDTKTSILSKFIEVHMGDVSKFKNLLGFS